MPGLEQVLRRRVSWRQVVRMQSLFERPSNTLSKRLITRYRLHTRKQLVSYKHLRALLKVVSSCRQNSAECHSSTLDFFSLSIKPFKQHDMNFASHQFDPESKSITGTQAPSICCLVNSKKPSAKSHINGMHQTKLVPRSHHILEKTTSIT